MRIPSPVDGGQRREGRREGLTSSLELDAKDFQSPCDRQLWPRSLRGRLSPRLLLLPLLNP